MNISTRYSLVLAAAACLAEGPTAVVQTVNAAPTAEPPLAAADLVPATAAPPPVAALSAAGATLGQAAEYAFDAEFRRVFDDVLVPNGLVLDRRSDRNTVSSAATGFTAYSLALMVERGSAERSEVLEIVRRGFGTTLAANPARNRGWLYHFTDAEGRPKPWSEVSTIDSAIFYAGFLRAAQTLGDPGLLAEVEAAIAAVDVPWMMRDGYFLHGLYWAGDNAAFLPYTWDDTSEGVMLYRLFDRPFTPRVVRHDYPLFVYYYPLCFFDIPLYADHLRAAVAWQIDHYGYTGITAGDGPQGYQSDDPNLISPLALFAVSGLVPAARVTLAEYGVDHMVPAYHVGSGWTAPDRVTIDYASAYILLVKSMTTVPMPSAVPAAPPESAAGP